MNSKRLPLALLILSLALVSPGCDDTDPVASSGSTIILSANPSNIAEGQDRPVGPRRISSQPGHRLHGTARAFPNDRQ